MAYREITATVHWQDKKCQWCGEQFKVGELLVLIVPTFEYKKQYKRLSCNVVMHAAEFHTLMQNNDMDEQKVWVVIGNHPVPRPKKPKNYTDEQQKEIRAFKQACDNYGYTIETVVEHTISMRQAKTSDRFVYSVYTKRIDFRTKKSLSIFDKLFTLEYETKIYNEMHRILGDGLCKEFSALGVINKAVEDVQNS